MEQKQQPESPAKKAKMDHSKMDHGSKKQEDNPSMGMEVHNHHTRMIADFKKRFYLVLKLTNPNYAVINHDTAIYCC